MCRRSPCQPLSGNRVPALSKSGIAMHEHDPPLAEMLRFAEMLCDEGRNITRAHFRTRLGVDTKADLSPVTVADRDTERHLRELIARRFPAHGIIGEEFGSSGPGRRYVWVIDPIDGTGSFIVGMPTFGTLLALLDDGRPVLGLIDMPMLAERWTGATGVPTALNGRTVGTRAVATLDAARLMTTSPDSFSTATAPALEALKSRAAITRYGGDCYAYGLLAAGHCDIVIETGLQPYDYLPLVAVVEGAGGVISDWAGRALGLNSDGCVLACATPDLHAKALELVQAAVG